MLMHHGGERRFAGKPGEVTRECCSDVVSRAAGGRLEARRRDNTASTEVSPGTF